MLGLQPPAGRRRLCGDKESEKETSAPTMTRTTEEILADLDKHASEFNFPVLDNAYVEFGAARLTAFRSTSYWVIVFEVLGFSTKEVQFVNDLYAYGSCVDGEGFICEEIPFISPAKHPIFDAQTSECIADWSSFAITLGPETMTFNPSRDDYAAAGIRLDRESGPGSLTEIDLLRFLIHKARNRFSWMTGETLECFSRCKGASKFIQNNSTGSILTSATKKRLHERISLQSLVGSVDDRDHFPSSIRVDPTPIGNIGLNLSAHREDRSIVLPVRQVHLQLNHQPRKPFLGSSS